jgi:hypothetical protein
LRPSYRRKKVPLKVVDEPKKAYVLSFSAGTYSLEGQPARLVLARCMQTDAGVYAIVGSRADAVITNRTVRMGDEKRKRQIQLDNEFLLA